jgi:hypothetical protein
VVTPRVESLVGTVFEVVFFATPFVEGFCPGDTPELWKALAHFQSRDAARDHKIGERVVIADNIVWRSVLFARTARPRTIQKIDRALNWIDMTLRDAL